MGQASSSRRRRENNHPPPPPTPSQFISSSSPPPPPPPPPPSNPPPPLPRTPPPPPPPPSFAFAANAPFPSPHYPPPNPYPAPQPPPFCSQYSPAFTNHSAYAAPPVGRSNYPYQRNGWTPFRPPPPPPPSQSAFQPQPPLPYVEHEKTTTVKSDINLHKTTIRLEADQQYADTHLVSFTFDAMVDGRITIYYFAKEGVNCSFSSLYPDITPVRVPFRKGLGQKFCQPSGTGIDLGFFELDDLSKPTSDDVFPLVISAEACSSPLLMDEQLGHPPPTLGHAQITQAIIERKSDEPFQVKVVKQILWIDGVHYELRELFGIDNLSEAEFDDSDPGKECVICMSEPKDTAVLPCRHMCMCRECAKVLRFQTNKCPICRQPVEQLIEIKVKNDSP